MKKIAAKITGSNVTWRVDIFIRVEKKRSFSTLVLGTKMGLF